MTAKQLEHIMVRSAGAETEIDTALADYFVLDLMARRLTEKYKSHNIRVGEYEINKLKDAGVIDYANHKDPRNFWALKGRKDTEGQMLVLKESSLEDFQKAIVSEDFNVYRMLPMIFKEAEISDPTITNMFMTVTTEGYDSLPSGFQFNGFQHQ